MRKIVIGSGLGLVAAAAPVQAFDLPLAHAPAGVTAAGAVSLEANPGNAGILIGLNKHQDGAIKGESNLKIKNEAGIKMGDGSVLKSEQQHKVTDGNQLKITSSGANTFKF